MPANEATKASPAGIEGGTSIAVRGRLRRVRLLPYISLPLFLSLFPPTIRSCQRCLSEELCLTTIVAAVLYNGVKVATGKPLRISQESQSTLYNVIVGRILVAKSRELSINDSNSRI